MPQRPDDHQPDRALRRQAVREVEGQQAPRAARPPGPLLRLDHAARGRSAGRVPEEAQRPVGHRRRDTHRARGGKFSKNVRIRRGGTYRVWTGSSAGSTRRTSARRSRSGRSASPVARRRALAGARRRRSAYAGVVIVEFAGALLVPRRRRPGLAVGLPARRPGLRAPTSPATRRCSPSAGCASSGVAGTQFRPRALDSDALAPGRPLELRREPANPHDANAIAVHAGGRHVGFVPRELAAELAPELDAGRPWSAVVLREQRASPRDPRSGRDDAAGARGLDRAPRGRLTLRHAAPRRTVRAPGRAPVTTPGGPLRRGRRRPDHRARVPAADGGAGRLARRRLPRRGAPDLDRVGRVARRAHRDRVGARLQLLPHPADRALHDRRERELGRARGLPDRGGDRQLGRAGRPRAGHGGRPAAARGRPRGRDGAAAAARQRARGVAARRGAAAGGGAQPAVRRDRARAGRGRRAARRVPAAGGDDPARHARRAGRAPRGDAAPPAGAGGAQPRGAAGGRARPRPPARRGGRDARAAPRGHRQDDAAARGLA